MKDLIVTAKSTSTVLRTKMKVLLVSDFNLSHSRGGAQRSNDIIIKKGIERGHDIAEFNYDSPFLFYLSDYDVVISSNLEVLSQTNQQMVVAITNHKCHVRLEHDSNAYWNNEFRKRFWENCKKSFFLTPFHHSFFLQEYGDIFPNVEIVPDPMDEFFSHIYTGASRYGIGYVGFMHQLKGTENFINYVSENPEKDFYVAAWGNENYENSLRSFKNVSFYGEIPFYEMPGFYSSIESLYYNPVCNEPFCRSVGEALLCSTKIIGESSKIGSLNMYNDDPTNFRSKCLNASTTFWEKIECL